MKNPSKPEEEENKRRAPENEACDQTGLKRPRRPHRWQQPPTVPQNSGGQHCPPRDNPEAGHRADRTPQRPPQKHTPPKHQDTRHPEGTQDRPQHRRSTWTHPPYAAELDCCPRGNQGPKSRPHEHKAGTGTTQQNHHTLAYAVLTLPTPEAQQGPPREPRGGHSDTEDPATRKPEPHQQPNPPQNRILGSI
ncbi:acidic proline-rich protein PRP25-like [Heterocephalus glaber]|uniref:Acidic proline-rich protein PRP25-like n=1 Tax=Heterocephalus glaber TaxID=10181 RepID=A0AAX6QU98_HETGA|nr:acidic proline-rich protein PRP25-like [Heterocephalus glaber]